MSGDERLGHNNPPDPTPIERNEQLIPVVETEIAKGPPTNAEDAGRLGELAVQVRINKAALVAERDAMKKPYADALVTIDRQYEPAINRATLAVERILGGKTVAGLIPIYQSREDERLRAEAEAKRLEAEDAARIAAHAADKAVVEGTIDAAVMAEQAAKDAAEAERLAKQAPTRSRVKGDFSPRALARVEYWSATVVDWAKARRHYRTNARIVKAYDDAVQGAADNDARKLKDPAKAPPGVT